MTAPSPRDILANPAAFATQPAVLQIAWAAHAHARGVEIRFDTLPEPAHSYRCENAPCATAEDIRIRLQGRAARIAARRGQAAQGQRA